MGRPRGLNVEYVERAPEVSAGLLGAVVTGAPEASVSAPLRVNLAMPSLGPMAAEVWRSELPIERGVDGPIGWSRTSELLLGAIAIRDAGPIAACATDAYRAIIPFVRASGYPNLVRLWNQFPRMLVEDDGLERYKAFCAGRAAGFEAEGFTLNGDLPAASAVGASGEGFVVTFLAARGPVTHVENPRQVSAFRYPRQYGPRSPSFARASRVDLDGESVIFVSGTASIVGHESLHRGVVTAQVEETIENLRLVYGAAARREIRSLDEVRGALYRIYVKHASDFETIRERVLARIGSDASCLWLCGDICRDELLVEIEMIGQE
jgi:chorismate lyase/3-hydroxybenzoate synthase